MSSIFEALQRSESERLGVATEQMALADLLQAAERAVPNEAKCLGPIDLGQCRSLPVSPSPHSRLVCLTANESLSAETFRFLGVRLRHLQQSRSIKKLLITSTMPEEGKSMVCGNLATTLARRRRQKVLLLEGDIRRPSLGSKFGLCQLPGLTEWLRGDRERIPNIYHLEGPGFWFLPAGSPAENSLELMQSGRLSELMNHLSAYFDWIVIDSPPVLSLADTSVWMRLTDGILLVMREGTTENRLLRRGLEALESSKLLGAVLNGSKNTDHSKYCQYYQGYSPATVKPQWDVRRWRNWRQLIKFSSLFSSFVSLAPKLARIGSARRFGEDVAFRILRSLRRVMERCHAKPGEIER
jgi:capsular exopolysaccharide synthesis family protein